MIEVPNFGTLSWKLLGKGHRHITEAHLFYYNKVSLSNLLENNGFEVLLIRNVPYFISLSWFFYRMSFKIFMANKILLKFSDYIRSIKIVIRSDLKDVLMVVARKAKGK